MHPVAAFTFGSFGDITAVLQVAWQLRRALSDANGAAVEIRELLLDLDSFTCSLQQIKPAMESIDAVLHADSMRGIALALGKCNAVLLSIRKETDAYSVHRRFFERLKVAVKWSIMGGKGEVDRLRRVLSEQLGVIQTYLAALQGDELSGVLAVIQHEDNTVEQISAITDKLLESVAQPLYHFYDPKAHIYYQPYGRMSYIEFKAKCEEFTGEEFSVPLNQINLNEYLHYVDLCGPDGSQESFACLFFRKDQLAAWQVLIGMPSATYKGSRSRLMTDAEPMPQAHTITDNHWIRLADEDRIIEM